MKKKRGAPRGNRNALKHGFYSRAFTPAENSALDANVLGQFKDEIPLLRILIARTAKTLVEEDANLSFVDKLAALRTMTLAIGRLESLARADRENYADLAELEKQIKTDRSLVGGNTPIHENRQPPGSSTAPSSPSRQEQARP